MTPDLIPIPVMLLDRFARAGLDVETILRRAALPRSRFNVAKPHGTTAEFYALWRAVEASGCGADLGLRLGVESLPHEENVASLAALHSPTLGEGLKKLARYKQLVCPEKIALDHRGGEVLISVEWFLIDEAPPTLLVDVMFAGLVNLAREGTGLPVSARRVELARRRANETMLRDHFQCDVLFDSPADILVLDEAALALPLRRANAQLLATLVPGLELAVASDDSKRTLADDVRLLLAQVLCGDRPSIDKIAKSLGMSPRTLQRRLVDLGTSYQKILDDVRHRSARRLLASTDLGPAEVAFLLGFEEVNSFARAFQIWEGTTPRKWRERTGSEVEPPSIE